MRRTAAVIERQAARSAQAMRRQARPSNTGASLSPLKHQQVQELLPRGCVPLSSSNPSASRPTSVPRDAVQKSQLVVSAAVSTTVPSVTCGAGGGRGRQCGPSGEQYVLCGQVTGQLKPRIERAARKVLPNPSVNRTRSGRRRKAGVRRLRHLRTPALRRPPTRAGYLER